MLKQSRLSKATSITYAVVAILFFVFAVYLFHCEKSTVYNTRDNNTYSTIESYSVQDVEDATAPIGRRTVYSWTVTESDANENYLAFYLVHQFAEVWLDDELVYSLTAGENVHIGTSPSSNWVFVPLYTADAGRTVRVVVTPAYESVAERKIQFLIGERSAIVMDQFHHDRPQIVLAFLCILVGLILMLTQSYLHLRKKTASWELFYLGNFSVLIGIWRITDTRFSSIMYAEHARSLGYITIASLFLCCIPLLFFLKERSAYGKTVLSVSIFVTSGVSLSVLLLQILGIVDLRPMLIVDHIMLLSCLIILLLVLLYQYRRSGVSKRGVWTWVLLLGVGLIADLLTYYLRDTSSNVQCTVSIFLLFTVTQFISSVLDINRKAYTDVRTGLFNKSRWDELMRSTQPITDPIGIMMLDLNRLKYVNDTMGHSAGDKMIFNFANILRNTIPPTNTICRWGGDEFTVMISSADNEKMERYSEAISNAVAAYNASDETPKIHYACGWALSAEHPALSRKELLDLADKRMYQNKKRWYDEQSIKR